MQPSPPARFGASASARARQLGWTWPTKPAIVRALAALAVSCSALGAGCHGLFIRPEWSGPARTMTTERFTIVSDASAASLVVLARACEDMLDELERLLPAPPGAPAERTRHVFAFSDAARFKTFLRAHLFAQERAIGFYCDLGGECALAWNDPPGPEDLRVLRHELVHQHLARRLQVRLPAWLEEGLAERLALGPLAAVAPVAPVCSRAELPPPSRLAARAPAALPEPRAVLVTRGWDLYRRHRTTVDAVFAALELQGGKASWPGLAGRRPTDVPPPRWATGDSGYVLHLLFLHYLEDLGEGRDGALGRAMARAREGDEPTLDLSHRFDTFAELEQGFRGFVLGAGLDALVADAGIADPHVQSLAAEMLRGTAPASVGAIDPAARNAGAAPR